MKLILSLGFALVATVAAQAQVFRSQVAGGNDHRRGPVVQVGVDHHHAHYGHFNRSSYGYRVAVPYRSYGYGRYYSSPVYGYYDGYTGYDYPYYGGVSYGTYGGSAASNGLLLGALAGGIIGHNSGEFRHNGWRGAAWGAGIGWLLGTIADSNRRAVTYSAPSSYYPSAATSVPVAVPAATAAPAATPAQPVTIINNYYGSASPMSGANTLFGR